MKGNTQTETQQHFCMDKRRLYVTWPRLLLPVMNFSKFQSLDPKCMEFERGTVETSEAYVFHVSNWPKPWKTDSLKCGPSEPHRGFISDSCNMCATRELLVHAAMNKHHGTCVTSPGTYFRTGNVLLHVWGIISSRTSKNARLFVHVLKVFRHTIYIMPSPT